MSDSGSNDFLGKFVYKLPFPGKATDYEVVMRTKLEEGYARFSVNFCTREDDIVYHFGLHEGELFQGTRNGETQLERMFCEPWEHPESGVMEHVFRFGVKASAEHNGSVYDLEHQIPFDKIEFLELRGDVECVQEVALRRCSKTNGV